MTAALALPATPTCGGTWLDTLIGTTAVWLLPTNFLPGARGTLAGLHIRRATGLYMPYLAHPVTRTTPHRTEQPA